MHPPYQMIADEISARIAAGEFLPGDCAPSVPQIMERYGVSMAAATKALSELRLQGLVRTEPGVGTVVAGPAERRGPLPGEGRRS